MDRHRVGTIIREIWSYRVYLKYETLGKLKLRHKGTLFGYLWWVLDPLLFMLIYYFVFQVVLKRGGDNYVLFLFCALLPWRWFATSVSESALSVRSSAGLIKQVYFPKVLLPLSAIFTNTVNFLFGLIILGGLMLWFRVEVGFPLLLLPLVILTQLLFTVGLGLLLADVDVLLKDTSLILRYVLQMWFYMSPAIYDISLIPQSVRRVYELNPFAIILTAYRDVCMFNRIPNLLALAVLSGVSLLTIWLGLKVMARHQGHYAKVL